MTAIEAILRDDPYPLRAMIVTGANPALTNPNSARVLRALEALDLLVVRDLFMTETARPGRLRTAGGLLPGAHRAARAREVPDRERDPPRSSPGRTCRTSTSSGATWPTVWASASTSPGRTRPPSNRWLLEPTGLTLEELEAHPEGVEYSPPRPAALEGDGLRHAVGQGRVRLAVPEGPGLRRAARVSEPRLPARARRRVPVRAHHGGAQAALSAQPLSQHPPLPHGHPRPRGRDASGRRRARSGWPTARRSG